MSTAAITKKAIETARPPVKGRKYLRDGRTPGLIVDITPSGAKTWYLYKKVKGRPQRIRLGGYPQMTIEKARKAAGRTNAVISQGGNPAEAKRQERGEATLGELWAEYLERHAKPHKRTWEGDKWLWERYLESWKNRRLSSIAQADVQAWHTRVGNKHGHYAANRGLALLSTMFSKASAAVGWTGANPARGVKKFREQSRDRYLLADELPKFLAAVKAEPNDILADAILAMLLTGARSGNVQAMRWEEINWTAATWRIPRIKPGDSQTVPLVPDMVAMLTRRNATATSEYVFPGRRGGHLSEIKTCWARVLKAAGIENLRPHDLRRTMGSWQAAAGVSLHVIGKSLGHKQASTTQIYARLDLDPVRVAMNTAATNMLAAGRKNGDAKDGGQADGEAK